MDVAVFENALDHVLAPITLQGFYEEHFEKSPLHVQRRNAAYFHDVYGVRDIEQSLTTGARQPEKFFLIKAGKQIPIRDFARQRPNPRWRQTMKSPEPSIDPHSVAAHFDKGYSLVILDAGAFSPRLQAFCSMLQRDLECYVEANVYFTPRSGAQGFKAHHDTHDTLLIQVEGSKSWRIYEPRTELPLESQPLSSGEGSASSLRPHKDVVVEAGDTLYIPRGYPHEAITNDERSLHVTFALIPVRVIDFLQSLLWGIAEQDIALRASLPRGWLQSDGFTRNMRAVLENCLRDAALDERMLRTREIAAAEMLQICQPNPDQMFTQLELIRELNGTSLLRPNFAIASSVREYESAAVLLLPGKTLTFPKNCAKALRHLTSGEMLFADIDPDLSAEHRTVLVKTLVLEGAIRIECGRNEDL